MNPAEPQRNRINREPSENLEDLIADLADRWTEAIRAGREPDLNQFREQYPELAELANPLLFSIRAMCDVANGSDERPTAGRDATQSDGSARAGIPPQVGDYDLVRELGHGGMGIVFAARHRALGRTVALKILPPIGMLTGRHRQRFQNEARAAAQLDHPNIVEVFEIGETGELYFFAMRFVHGATLEQILARAKRSQQPGSNHQPMSCADPTSPLGSGHSPTDASQGETDLAVPAVWSPLEFSSSSWFTTVAITVRDAALAIDHAHEHGVVHRDLKPSNLMIDQSGKLWVTDFGLASCEANPTLTATGDLLGTLRYMSPEQASGGNVSPLHLADVYSLGATLYELLTLTPLNDGRERSALMRQIAQPIHRSPRRKNPAVPRSLEAITMKACAFEPADRYVTAGAMAEDLNRYLAGEHVLARRPGAASTLAVLIRRHRDVVLTMIAGLVGMCLLLVIATVLIERSRRRAVNNEQQMINAYARQTELRQEAEQHRRKAESALRDADRARRKADQQLWAASVAEAEARLASVEGGRREKTLAAIRTAAQAMAPGELSEPQQIRIRSLAAAALLTTDLEVTAEYSLADHSHMIETTEFSPDFHTYTQHRHHTISVRDVATNKELASLPLIDFPLACRFSRDGSRLCVVGEEKREGQNSIRVFDWQSGDELVHLSSTRLGAEVQRMAVDFSPLTHELAVGLADNRVVLVPLPPLRGPGSETVPLSHSELALASVATSAAPHGLHYSPDGTALAISCTAAKACMIVGIESSGEIGDSQSFELTDEPYAIQWHPSGRRLAIGTGFTITTFALHTDRITPEFIYREQNSPVHELFYHPSGELLAAHGYDGTTRLWETRDQNPVVEIAGHVSRFATDGSQVAIRGSEQLAVCQVHFRDEYNVFADGVHDEPAPQDAVMLHGDRIMAIAGRRGLQLWDTASLRHRGTVTAAPPTDLDVVALASGDRESILVCGGETLLRVETSWDGIRHTVRWSSGPDESVGWRIIGSPALLAADRTQTLRVLMPQQGSTAWVFRGHDAAQPLKLAVRPDFMDIDRSGRWLACGFKPYPHFIVTDLEHPNDPITLSSQRSGPVLFANIGGKERLITSSPSRYQIWELGNWSRPLHEINRPDAVRRGTAAATEAGDLLAINYDQDEIWIIETSQFRQLLSFRIPGDQLIHQLGFRADGSGLVVVSTESVCEVQLRRLLGQVDQMTKRPPAQSVRYDH